MGSFDCNVYAINPDGTKKWSFTTGGPAVSAPAIGVDGTVYFGSEDYSVYAIGP
jgi:outer membrane protein assembly factor BamB